MTSHSRWPKLALLGLLALLAGVTDAAQAPQPPTNVVVNAAAAWTVTPSTATINVGATVQLASDSGSGSVWTSRDPSKATVNSGTGLVTGVAAGVAVITVRKGNKTGQATVTVTSSSVITAASCSQADVASAINAAPEGYVVQIPAGTCTWTAGITVPAGRGLTIRGSGTPASAAATIGASASCVSTVITDNSNSSLLRLRPVLTSALSRISCLKVRTDNAAAITAPFAAAGTCTASGCPSIRIDNITFDSSLQGQIADSGGLILTDNVFGVIDHNTATALSGSIGMQFIEYNHSAWKGVGAYGDNSWTSAGTFGTAQMVYLENNAWTGPGIVIGETEAQVPNGGQGGGRIAGRFNTCSGCASGLSNHGTDSNGRPRGGRQIEFYGNTFHCTNTASGCQGGVPIRSGVNIMFGNTLTAGPGSWFNQYLALAAFRAGVIWGPPWGECNGSGLWDNNLVSPPICLDQPGRSGSILLSGFSPTPVGWVEEAIDPNYEWMDSGYNPVFGNVSASYAGMIANRDWYTDNSNGTPVAQTSASSPFAGATGMGFGLIARRPTTCTVGVAYWATDQGSWNVSGNSFGQGNLYVCTATNTWTLRYTPYAYPHPLVAP